MKLYTGFHLIRKWFVVIRLDWLPLISWRSARKYSAWRASLVPWLPDWRWRGAKQGQGTRLHGAPAIIDREPVYVVISPTTEYQTRHQNIFQSWLEYRNTVWQNINKLSTLPNSFWFTAYLLIVSHKVLEVFIYGWQRFYRI